MSLYIELLEILSSAVKSLSTSKLRSFLTILGIVIGITSVTVISSVGNGLQNAMVESLDGLGLDRLEVYVNSLENINSVLYEEDGELLKSHNNVSYVIPFLKNHTYVNERITEEPIFISMDAVSEEYTKILNREIVNGRFLMNTDIENRRNVIVIPERLSERYFGYKNSIGETFTISLWGDLLHFTVIGITESNRNDIFFSATPEVFVPYTFMQDFLSSSGVDGLYVGIENPEYSGETAEELNKMLQIKNGTDENTYRVYNMMQEMDDIKLVFSQVVLFVNVVASIALFVGSIGIMNIMLVTVTERTREIGIRKALGATKRNIRLQFLIEAVVLSIIGGIIGTSIGYLLAIVVGSNIDVTPEFSLYSILMSLLVCSLIGILSGVYPASKASNLSPIEALRYE